MIPDTNVLVKPVTVTLLYIEDNEYSRPEYIKEICSISHQIEILAPKNFQDFKEIIEDEKELNKVDMILCDYDLRGWKNIEQPFEPFQIGSEKLENGIDLLNLADKLIKKMRKIQIPIPSGIYTTFPHATDFKNSLKKLSFKVRILEKKFNLDPFEPAYELEYGVSKVELDEDIAVQVPSIQSVEKEKLEIISEIFNLFSSKTYNPTENLPSSDENEINDVKGKENIISHSQEKEGFLLLDKIRTFAGITYPEQEHSTIQPPGSEYFLKDRVKIIRTISLRPIEKVQVDYEKLPKEVELFFNKHILFYEEGTFLKCGPFSWQIKRGNPDNTFTTYHLKFTDSPEISGLGKVLRNLKVVEKGKTIFDFEFNVDAILRGEFEEPFTVEFPEQDENKSMLELSICKNTAILYLNHTISLDEAEKILTTLDDPLFKLEFIKYLFKYYAHKAHSREEIREFLGVWQEKGFPIVNDIFNCEIKFWPAEEEEGEEVRVLLESLLDEGKFINLPFNKKRLEENHITGKSARFEYTIYYTKNPLGKSSLVQIGDIQAV